MWCPEILFSRSLCMGPVLYPKEIYGIVLYLIFSMSFHITFKKKSLTCGSQVGLMWVTSGLLSESSGSTGVIHFQPCFVYYACMAFFHIHRPHLFLATSSRFIFEIVRNTPIISELHPYFWHACLFIT